MATSMGTRLATLATCSLNQWALDFDGNLERVVASCAAAKAGGATFRVGPELELPGYGCEDHFLEPDTEAHAWESVAVLLRGDCTTGLVVDTGLPVTHRGVRYNARAFLLNGRVLLLRPKLALAGDGNYREGRWFAAWAAPPGAPLEPFRLPDCVAAVAGQTHAPIGDAVIDFTDACLATELCEELFVPVAPHSRLALAGVEVFSNGSGSHHALRKLHVRLDLLRAATAHAGGAYLYANQRGCDGGRLYFDGCAAVALNGEIIAQGRQFALADVEVVTATVDLDSIVAKRGAFAAMRAQAAAAGGASPIARVSVDFRLCGGGAAGGGVAGNGDAQNSRTRVGRVPSPPIPPSYHSVEEEIALGPACWLWDYLRRSGAAGFLLPLSGGADSAAVAAIVGSMCQLAVGEATSDDRVAADVRRLYANRARVGDETRGGGADATREAREPLPTPRQLASVLLSTLYLGTENSGPATRRRAADLASQIGASHLSFDIDAIVSAGVSIFCAVTRTSPRFAADGGCWAENLALQNIQARCRMVVSFLFAQLLPWATMRPHGGFLLVLGAANVDECLRGYMTKYDCSSADVNPIGGMSKSDLGAFLRWGATGLGYPALAEIAAAPPSAELEPRRDGIEQTDEADMGCTYEELSAFGRLRQASRCGPVSMFRALVRTWAASRGLFPSAVADKVKRFFVAYGVNRHKATTLTPSYHAEAYSPDDNRFDHRPFLYSASWSRQFGGIDDDVAAMEAGEGGA